MRPCYLCQEQRVTEVLDLGKQPISNRFLADQNAEESLFPLGIAYCRSCGLVQISRPVPAEELRPRFDWISYNEPEQHLDVLADIVAHLPGLTTDSSIWGVSSKDDSLLRRMERLGFSRTYRLDPAVDFGISGRNFGVETIQDRINSERLDAIAGVRGRPQVVIARHIIEHAHNLRHFLDALLSIIAPHGYIVLEAPDCQRAFDAHDYTTIWEEHTVYFTPQTFRLFFLHAGLGEMHFEVFPYAFENVIVGIGQVAQGITVSRCDQGVLENEERRILAFANGLPDRRRKLTAYFSEYRKQNGKIALFGAGHMACAFVNFLNLKEHIMFVADDDAKKQRLYMPGSRLPIRPSAALLDNNITLCLCCFSPEAENRVIAKNHAFSDRGGQFASIFPASSHYLKV